MHCTNCYCEFGLLKKEVACEICKLAFCSKCCKKQKISSDDGVAKAQMLCVACFQKLGDPSSTMPGSPPLAYKKRVAALTKQSHSIDSGAHAQLVSQWSDAKDRLLAERLQRLKRDKIKDNCPSEDEIQERLAVLKGINPDVYKAPPIEVFRPDKRTSIEQVYDLLKQAKEEADLDSHLVKPEDDIAERLARLRGESPKEVQKGPQATGTTVVGLTSEDVDMEEILTTLQKDSKTLSETVLGDVRDLQKEHSYKEMLDDMNIQEEPKSSVDIDDDDEEAEKLIEKLMATDMTDVDELEVTDPSSESVAKNTDEERVEEFPWCTICSEDAKIRCFGCDSDLYCRGCFKECHDSLDIRDHKTCPYLAPKGSFP